MTSNMTNRGRMHEHKWPRRPSTRRRMTFAAFGAVVGLAALAAGARAQAPSFVAEVDRTQIAPGDAFTYEVTLNVAEQQVAGFAPPDFRGLQVLQAPRAPSRATHMQIGGGGTFIQNSLTWEFQIAAPAQSKGLVTIGPARVRVDGREMRSNSVNIRVAAGAPPAAAPARRPGRSPFGMPSIPGFTRPAAPPPPAQAAPSGAAPAHGPPALASAPAANFLRVVPDKTSAFVGEQVTVSWYLYTQGMDNYETVAEPRTDAFWTEDVTPVSARKGSMTLTQEQVGGRTYQVATLFKKALFALQPGKLTVSPLESQVSQVDFFGATLRRQRLKAEPTVIEAIPLPKAGQPDNFDLNNVGRFIVAVRADRTSVAVGEAVTLTIDIKGEGNVRNVRPPPLPALEGWKRYDPKINVVIDPGETVAGTKSLEYLLLPERPGAVMVTSLSLPYFDPQAKAYATARSEPLRLEATGADVAKAMNPGGAGKAEAGPVDNVIAAEIRPIRARSAPRRDLGATFYRSRAFLGILLIPPLGLALTVLAGRLRERMGSDTQRTRRRRVRTLIRRRLSAAEDHRDAGRTSAFYIEIDRVVREVLSARLGRAVSGLRMDELRELLRRRGVPGDIVERVADTLEDCDRARFAPGTGDVGRDRMNAALERAGDLIVVIEKARLNEEGGA
jgi:hypothetical protein